MSILNMHLSGQLTFTNECSSDSEYEPTTSVAPATSDVSTAAPGLPSQPVARINRAPDVLNAPTLLGKRTRPISIPGTLVLEIWKI